LAKIISYLIALAILFAAFLFGSAGLHALFGVEYSYLSASITIGVVFAIIGLLAAFKKG
jgi:hypothetical protein